MHSDQVAYFILDLLQHVPSVHVPGLGRFDAIFHPAVVDYRQYKISPPHLEAVFSTDSKNDKVLLAEYMQYVSGISLDEARDEIESFVRRVQQHLEEGQPYSIEKFGSFSESSSSHAIHFTPDWDAFNLSFRGLQAVDLKHTSSEETIERHVSETVVEAIPSASSVATEAQPQTNWITDGDYLNQDGPVEIQPMPSPGISGKTSRMWWMILASALSLITILCVYLAWDIFSNRNRINQYIAISNDSLAEASPDIIIVDTLDFIEEPLPEDSVDQPVSPPEEPTRDVIVNPCFVVVGAFSNPANVSRMEERLRDLGHQTERITGGSLTRVAIRTPCSQVQQTLNEARSSINPEAWLY